MFLLRVGTSDNKNKTLSSKLADNYISDISIDLIVKNYFTIIIIYTCKHLLMCQTIDQ